MHLQLDPEKTAFIFPGQGSQFIGMGKELACQYSEAEGTFLQAEQILGYKLSEICWNGPADLLNDTIFTQPALLVHSIAAYKVLRTYLPNFSPKFVAGHSLGEISSLMAARAIEFTEALKIVAIRGASMKHTGMLSPGGMYAIIGLNIDTVEVICKEASSPEQIVQVANDNAPGQVIISGSDSALANAICLAHKAGARRIIKLLVSIAAHSSLMEPAQKIFSQAIEDASIHDAQIPVISNVTSLPITARTQIKQDLIAQLTNKVRWVESVRFMANQGIKTFIEIGSGSVLSGLITRIDPTVTTLQLGNPEDIQAINFLSN